MPAVPTRLTALGAARPERVRWAVVAGVIAIGALHVISYRQVSNPDGISYLDAGEAWWSGDWDVALSPYWSPLYSVLTGGAVHFVDPSPRWEAPLVQAVNFAVYCFVAATYGWLVREIRRAGAAPGLGEAVWTVLAWSVFVWCVYWLTMPTTMSPDLLSAGLVFLAAGCLVRLVRGAAGAGTFAALGLVLGFNALAKAAMFPMALVILAVATLAVRPLRRAVARGALAALVFAVVVAPYVVALSAEVGRPTFGESGRLNYAWYVDGLPPVHWQGEPPGYGTPVHPTRRLSSTPDAFTFARPGHGSIPTWYDPVFWNEGVRPRFDLHGHVRVLGDAFTDFAGQAMFIVPFLGLLAGSLMLARAGPGVREARAALLRWWPLLVTAVAVVAMYSAVHLEQRHTGAFAALFWLPVLAAVGGRGLRRPRLRTAGVLTALAGTVLMLGAGVVRDLRNVVDRPEQRDEQWRVAAGLEATGAGPGARLVFVGDDQESSFAYFVRLSGSQLVADIVGPADFWHDTPAERERLLALIVRETHADAVVTPHAPPAGAEAGWRPIPQTRFYVRRLDR